MADDAPESISLKATNPYVFISHDTRDGELAEAFSNLLKSVSAGVLKSFRTSDRRGNQGIEYGVEWYPEIIKNIQSASDVVCLLTRRSVDRPWILFEAGMAKGKLDTPILGVALGIQLKDASTGPFAQFQNCADDEDSLTKLVFQLVGRIPHAEPDRDTIRFQVGKFREKITEILQRLDDVDAYSNSGEIMAEVENSSAKLFEEIKIMFQDLPSRIEKRVLTDGRRRRRKLHPGMLDELMHVTKDPKLSMKIALSFYREKMPWLYDEGITILNRMNRPTVQIEKVFSDFERLLMITVQSPAFEILINDEEEYFFLRELPHMILNHFHRAIFGK